MKNPDGEAFWYGGSLIPNKPSRYTPEEQLEMLDTHPFFTGVCLKCSYKFDKAPGIHWSCPACGYEG